MSKELDKPNHMSEHSEGSTLTEQDKANAAFIIEACNNYEAVKKERDEAFFILHYAKSYILARLTAVSGDSEKALLKKLENQIEELLNK